MAQFGRRYDGEYGYRGWDASQRRPHRYGSDYKSQWQTDHGDPFGDRVRHTPFRTYTEEYGHDYRSSGIGYDRGYHGRDSGYGAIRSNRGIYPGDDLGYRSADQNYGLGHRGMDEGYGMDYRGVGGYEGSRRAYGPGYSGSDMGYGRNRNHPGAADSYGYGGMSGYGSREERGYDSAYDARPVNYDPRYGRERSGQVHWRGSTRYDNEHGYDRGWY